MAKLHPELETIKKQKILPTDGEWALLNFLLAKLDDTYEIFFQPFINGDNPDFAILRRGSGLLLIEAADSRQNEPMNGFDKLESYKKNLFYLHCAELFIQNTINTKHWATVGCAMYVHNPHPEDKQPNKFQGLLTQETLNDGELQKLLYKLHLNRPSHLFTDELYFSIRRRIKPAFHRLEDGIQITYTKEQQALINSAIGSRRKIKGVAGSGKTVVLAKRAVNAQLRTNTKVLILTFNITLCNYIRDKISNIRAEFDHRSFEIFHYHLFIREKYFEYFKQESRIEDYEDIDLFAHPKRPTQKNLSFENFAMRTSIYLNILNAQYKNMTLCSLMKYKTINNLG